MVFEKFKRRLAKTEKEEEPEYIEIDLEKKSKDSHIFVKTFVLKNYDDINPILNALREGNTIVVIDIKGLKSKDVIELKRVISKIKKTVEALEGSIVGFGENIVLATPSFAIITRGDGEEKHHRTSNLGKF